MSPRLAPAEERGCAAQAHGLTIARPFFDRSDRFLTIGCIPILVKFTGQIHWSNSLVKFTRPNEFPPFQAIEELRAMLARAAAELRRSGAFSRRFAAGVRPARWRLRGPRHYGWPRFDQFFSPVFDQYPTVI